MKDFLKVWIEIFRELRQILFCALGLLFLYGSLQILYRDGSEIFREQKNALVLEVFSKTDLNTDGLKLLEEELRSLDGVTGVVSSSPESSLERLLQEPGLELDPQWLTGRSKEKKGMILPWSYTLHVARWDEPYLKELVEKINYLEVGSPKKKAVAEVHYDQERWSLVVALFHYLKWIRVVLITGILLLCLVLILLFGTVLLRWLENKKASYFTDGHGKERRKTFLVFFSEKFNFQEMFAALFAGAGIGLAATFLCLLVLAGSFFSDSVYWSKFLGDFLFLQIFLGMFIVFAGFLHKRIHEK